MKREDLPAFQQRLLEEYEELRERLSKLSFFIINIDTYKIDYQMMVLLRKQEDCMKELLAILRARIEFLDIYNHVKEVL